MGRYAVVANGAAGGADKGILAIGSDGNVRCAVYDILLGTDATPADAAGEYVVNRNTDTGTGGTAVTPRKTDPLSAAADCTCTAGAYATTEPADTANSELLNIALNTRATFRWVAAPGSELYGVVAAGDGIFLRSVAQTTTTAMNATILYFE